jgi:hypothetical protein
MIHYSDVLKNILLTDDERDMEKAEIDTDAVAADLARSNIDLSNVHDAEGFVFEWMHNRAMRPWEYKLPHFGTILAKAHNIRTTSKFLKELSSRIVRNLPTILLFAMYGACAFALTASPAYAVEAKQLPPSWEYTAALILIAAVGLFFLMYGDTEKGDGQ